MKISDQLEEKLGKGRIKINEPMFLHTTFQIGGPSDYYFEAKTVEELVKIVELAKKIDLPYFILGGGSNILVGDKGFRGIVIKNKTKKIKILSYSGSIKNKQNFSLNKTSSIKQVLVEVDSGVPLNQLVRFTIEEGLSGLAQFLGLPGTVGGAVNVGAHWFDKKVSDLVISKKTIDQTLLSVIFKLKKADSQSLWQKGRESVARRQKKHPLGFPSAGCVFQNIKKSDAARLGTPNLICSAGFLIEAAGLKGLTIGKMQISPQHTNFIVNLGGGRAEDVLELIKVIKQKIKDKFKVELKEEIIKVGEF